jgi:hypothetical protein
MAGVAKSMLNPKARTKAMTSDRARVEISLEKRRMAGRKNNVGIADPGWWKRRVILTNKRRQTLCLCGF